MARTRWWPLTALLPILMGSGPVAAATERVSVSSGGVEATVDSSYPDISADGRFIAFYSQADTHVAGDSNGVRDVFVRDRDAGTTERVSVSSSGTQGNHHSNGARISADGRYVVFYSLAENLVAGDTNGYSDVFVHDRQTGQTERISVDTDGLQANGRSYSGPITPDGRYVVFTSQASNLVVGDGNGQTDVFVRDRVAGTTERVSLSTTGGDPNGIGAHAPSISDDGRYVAYYSIADNLVANDTNGVADIFVYDRSTDTTVRASVGPGGTEANGLSYDPSISADGSLVAFGSYATNLVGETTNGTGDLFIHDLTSGVTTLASVRPDGQASTSSDGVPSLSADNRYLAFFSYSDDLVVGDTNGEADIFVRDRTSGTTTRVNLGPGAVEADARSRFPRISRNGQFVAYQSEATNLISGDSNGVSDVFVSAAAGAASVPTLSSVALSLLPLMLGLGALRAFRRRQ